MNRYVLRWFVVILIIEYFLLCVNIKIDFFRQNKKKGSDNLIYDKIKEICEKKGVSVGSVERQAGLGNGAISKWNTSSPTIEKLQAVADVLKVNINKLIS